jgi:hypothetical protein
MNLVPIPGLRRLVHRSTAAAPGGHAYRVTVYADDDNATFGLVLPARAVYGLTREETGAELETLMRQAETAYAALMLDGDTR